MKLSQEKVKKIASLARLEVAERDLERFVRQFHDILSYMDKLNELSTTGVEPLYSPVEHDTPFREDLVGQGFDRDEILANAPDDDGRYFIVPKVL